jgi:acyl-coenzyme A synthetase/AMP-(fatty) acid ligase
MTPEFYEFLAELPRSSTGKINRRALAARTQPPAAAANFDG